jgi:hypothetical protein
VHSVRLELLIKLTKNPEARDCRLAICKEAEDKQIDKMASGGWNTSKFYVASRRIMIFL